MSPRVVGTLIGGILVGLVGFALDYFFLQHFLRTPISMLGGVNFLVVALYLVVPFLILWIGGGQRSRS